VKATTKRNYNVSVKININLRELYERLSPATTKRNYN
jgi:hypothetical protein